jgi:hypothetical protein
VTKCGRVVQKDARGGATHNLARLSVENAGARRSGHGMWACMALAVMTPEHLDD